MLLPYASDRRPRRLPIVVVAIVLLQFAVFGLIELSLLSGRDAAIVWYVNLSLVPGSLHWWSPFTYAFVHDSLFHVSSNGLFLWVFGSSVEDALGWKRFLGFYLIAAAISGLLQAVVQRTLGGPGVMDPIVGSSGAISAIVGVFAVRFYRSRIRFIGLPVRIPAVVLLAFVLLTEMGVALAEILTHRASGHVAAHWAHIGGFLLGIVWAQAARMVRAGRSEYLAADAAMEMERGSPLAATVRWEAVLEGRPDDLHARAELGRAWALAGDREQAGLAYTTAIAGLLRSGAKREAADRYLETLGFIPDICLGPADQLAIALALEETGRTMESLPALDALLKRHSESREAEMALLRSGALLLRRLDSPAEAMERLERFLDGYPTTTWRSYAEDLLRTAREKVRKG